MTPPPSTPQPADRASARHQVCQILTRAHTLWRDMTGESAYNRCLERYAHGHTQHLHGHRGTHGSRHDSGYSPMSECKFWCVRAKQVEMEIDTSCC